MHLFWTCNYKHSINAVFQPGLSPGLWVSLRQRALASSLPLGRADHWLPWAEGVCDALPSPPPDACLWAFQGLSEFSSLKSSLFPCFSPTVYRLLLPPPCVVIHLSTCFPLSKILSMHPINCQLLFYFSLCGFVPNSFQVLLIGFQESMEIDNMVSFSPVNPKYLLCFLIVAGSQGCW